MIKFFEATGKTVDEALDNALAMHGGSLSMVDVDVEVLDSGSKGLFGLGFKMARVRVSYEVPDEPAAKIERSAEKPLPKSERFEKSGNPEKVEKSEKFEKFEKKEKFGRKEKFEKKPAELPEKPVILATPIAPAKKDSIKTSFAGNEQPKRQGFDKERFDKDSFDKKKRFAEERRRALSPEDFAAGSQSAKGFLSGLFGILHIEPQIEAGEKDDSLCLTVNGNGMGVLIGRRGETLNALQYLTNLVVNHQRKNELIRVFLDVEGYRQDREATLCALAQKMADKAVASGKRIEMEPMTPGERRIIHTALQEDDRVETASYGTDPYRRVVINKRRTFADK